MADKTKAGKRTARDLMNDPAVKEMFEHRDTRLLFGAFWCGLLIKNGHTPNPEAVEYLRKEYSAAELESAAAELEADAANHPRLADKCRRGAAFIREQLLQGVTA